MWRLGIDLELVAPSCGWVFLALYNTVVRREVKFLCSRWNVPFSRPQSGDWWDELVYQLEWMQINPQKASLTIRELPWPAFPPSIYLLVLLVLCCPESVWTLGFAHFSSFPLLQKNAILHLIFHLFSNTTKEATLYPIAFQLPPQQYSKTSILVAQNNTSYTEDLSGSDQTLTTYQRIYKKQKWSLAGVA